MDMKKQAKLDVLKQIRQIASEAMKDDMKSTGLKKVSVAAGSTKGLEEGLEKAKEMLKNPEDLMGQMGHMGGMDEEMGESEDESYEEEASEEEASEEEESPESIEEQIKALEEKKAKMMKK